MEGNPKEIINYFTFNQDFSCIAIGTQFGFKIYYLNPYELITESEVGSNFFLLNFNIRHLNYINVIFIEYSSICRG